MKTAMRQNFANVATKGVGHKDCDENLLEGQESTMSVNVRPLDAYGKDERFRISQYELDFDNFDEKKEDDVDTVGITVFNSVLFVIYF